MVEVAMSIDDILDAEEPGIVENQCNSFFKPGFQERVFGDAPLFVKGDGGSIAFARTPQGENAQVPNLRTVLMESNEWDDFVTLPILGGYPHRPPPENSAVQELYEVPGDEDDNQYQALLFY